MIYLLPFNLITSQLLDIIVDKLKEKTNMFDYIDVVKYKHRLKTGQLTLWMTNECAIIGQLINYETGLKAMSLTVVNVTDKPIQDYQSSLKKLEEELKQTGIDRIILDGRLGWIKRNPDYKLSAIKLIKDI